MPTPYTLIGLNILGEHIVDVPKLKSLVAESGMSSILMIQNMGLAHELCDLSPHLKVMFRMWYNRHGSGDGGWEDIDSKGGVRQVAEDFSRMLGPHHRDRIIFTPLNEGGTDPKRVAYECQFVDEADRLGYTNASGNWGAGFSDEQFYNAMPIYQRVSGTKHWVNYHEYAQGRNPQFHGLLPLGKDESGNPNGEWIMTHFDPLYMHTAGDPTDLRNYSNWATGTAARHEWILRNLHGLTMNHTCVTETFYDSLYVSCWKGHNADKFDVECERIPAEIFISDHMAWMVDNVWDTNDETNPYYQIKGLYQGSNIFTYGSKAEGWYKFNCEGQQDIYDQIVLHGNTPREPVEPPIEPPSVCCDEIDQIKDTKYNENEELESINRNLAEEAPVEDLEQQWNDKAELHDDIKILYK